MSLDLTDLKRLKITAETAVWLEAESRTSGRSKQEILREEMHLLAIAKLHAAKVLSALALAEGISGDNRGRS